MRNRTKIITGSLLGAAAVLLGIYLFVDTIVSPEWDDKRHAVETAYAETMLARADRVEPFVGSEPYMIVYGEDKIGHKMVVWVSESERYAAYESEGITREEAEAKVLAADPGNRIIRSTPGKFEQDYVWEVYYERQQDGVTRHFYDYYRFSDGVLLDTLRLG